MIRKVQTVEPFTDLKTLVHFQTVTCGIVLPQNIFQVSSVRNWTRGLVIILEKGNPTAWSGNTERRLKGEEGTSHSYLR
ncbi:hypothetical protein JOB18_008826 [Solea senegalensis]|uniref:Uncharacterized protein n=1 Tax=Solea senegalensis TaxID=28829 RepID=A0AAV6RUF0_SOLSE|nr:hypothetical protein JOB18_008826 [Solea senegalensis]